MRAAVVVRLDERSNGQAREDGMDMVHEERETHMGKRTEAKMETDADFRKKKLPKTDCCTDSHHLTHNPVLTHEPAARTTSADGEAGGRSLTICGVRLSPLVNVCWLTIAIQLYLHFG